MNNSNQSKFIEQYINNPLFSSNKRFLNPEESVSSPSGYKNIIGSSASGSAVLDSPFLHVINNISNKDYNQLKKMTQDELIYALSQKALLAENLQKKNATLKDLNKTLTQQLNSLERSSMQQGMDYLAQVINGRNQISALKTRNNALQQALHALESPVRRNVELMEGNKALFNMVENLTDNNIPNPKKPLTIKETQSMIKKLLKPIAIREQEVLQKEDSIDNSPKLLLQMHNHKNNLKTNDNFQQPLQQKSSLYKQQPPLQQKIHISSPTLLSSLLKQKQQQGNPVGNQRS